MKLCTKQEMLRKMKKVSGYIYEEENIFWGNVNNILIDY